MDFPLKDESDFERIRKENMKRNEEEFKKLFPASLLNANQKKHQPTSPMSENRPNRSRNLTPRTSLRRSCKREREPSPDTFSDGNTYFFWV